MNEFDEWLKRLSDQQKQKYNRTLRKIQYYNETPMTVYCKDLDYKLHNLYMKYKLTKKQKRVVEKIRKFIHEEIHKQEKLNNDVPCVVVVKDYERILRKLNEHDI